ncbi:sugar transferase [Gammaproteobacteria bacterium]|nr:sugar transferase [Gammaproteobacteria bacterium]
MQRVLDIFFSGVALFLLMPLLLLLILILKFTGEGEIFFLQDRVGIGGKSFKLYKFATMLKNSPNIGTGTVTLHKDPRILPFGGWLRSTKINELPQLVNIFIGDMSIIGPRPQTQRCFNAFPKFAQKDIIKVRPGLSGIGSIVFRNEESMMHANADPDRLYDNLIMPYKGKLESWFVRNNSLCNYFLIISLTIIVILTRSTGLIFQLYPSLPRPPQDLSSFISSDYYE